MKGLSHFVLFSIVFTDFNSVWWREICAVDFDFQKEQREASKFVCLVLLHQINYNKMFVKIAQIKSNQTHALRFIDERRIQKMACVYLQKFIFIGKTNVLIDFQR